LGRKKHTSTRKKFLESGDERKGLLTNPNDNTQDLPKDTKNGYMLQSDEKGIVLLTNRKDQKTPKKKKLGSGKENIPHKTPNGGSWGGI